MRLLLAVCCLLLSACATQAQGDHITKRDISGKALDFYREALIAINRGDTERALRFFEKSLKKEPKLIDAYLEIGGIYRRKGAIEEAQENWDKAIALAPDYDPGLYFAYGSMLFQAKRYDEAAEKLERYLSYPTQDEYSDAKAELLLGSARFIPQAKAHPVPFEPKNLGENVNTPAREYFPAVTADAGMLVFTRQLGQGRDIQEDLFYSVHQDSAWQQSIPFKSINTPRNEAAQSISADGRFLVFTTCNRAEDYGSCDLYFSERIGDNWTEPRNIGAPINTPEWESQPSVSANGRALYFTRARPKGQGVRNLWVSYRKADGSWTAPQQLGINTPFNESGPCIHPDGKTLYFSSDGYPGMGDQDLFVTRKQADGSWSKPQNLGYPINTPDKEESMAVSLSGELAYLASNRPEGYGSMDIYSFPLHEAVRPSPVTYVRGRVFDAATKRPLPAQVWLANSKQDSSGFWVRTDQRGRFLLCLPLGASYALRVDKTHYFFYSDHFDLQKGSREEPFEIEIPLRPIPQANVALPSDEPPTPIVLRNVFFEPSSAALQPQSRSELLELTKLLENNPDMRIQINGHTDKVGTEEENLALSQARAESVQQFLIQQGIAANRLKAKGFGESKPIATNDTKTGRALNRRTTFIPL